MTHRARRNDREGFLGTPVDVPDRDAVPGRGELLEFLGLTVAAGAFVLFVLRPEFPEGLAHALAARAAVFAG
ncbi:hypothetical protein ADK65_01680 [Streptomyces sp. NRRL B-1140]|uniref:hypothetical protein n=1 Tax=Streptomyces sp. NRRL B-1140 TaxID=1415549 RepID=UPI0006AFCDD2|nr:hypothetical protein [Streptomyces sp. NRRL B-1140]KOX06471.1 hypothetical protein ADK65_01680 [Streptomyces sp. NRRL B-1140]